MYLLLLLFYLAYDDSIVNLSSPQAFQWKAWYANVVPIGQPIGRSDFPRQSGGFVILKLTRLAHANVLYKGNK